MRGAAAPGATVRAGRHMGGRSSKMVQVGDAFPAIKLDDGFAGLGCPKVDMAERLAGKKSIVVGLPGAFTPT